MTESAIPAEHDRPDIQAAIAECFGTNAGMAERYAEVLCSLGIERGVIGPREAGRIWERHVLNCAAIAPLIPQSAKVIDLGSGAGLPGIPVAIARPDLDVILLEPLLRRVRFLEECLGRLAMPQLSIHRGRGEDGLAERGDVVIVRAVAGLGAIISMSSALLNDDGIVLALKGEGAASEVEQLGALNGIDVEVVTLPAPGQPATVVRVTGAVAARPPAVRQAKRRR